MPAGRAEPSEAPAEESRAAAGSRRRRSLVIKILVAVVVLVAAAAVIWPWLESRWAHVSVDDARIGGSLVTLSSAVSDTVSEVPVGAGLFGSTYLLPLFVQTIQGFTPTDAGLLLMPSGFVLVVIFPIAGRLSDRLQPGILIGFGLIVFCYACWLTASADINTSFGDLAYWTALTRVGLGLLFPALTAGSLRVLPRELLAQGSGAVNFTRQLGGALGTNLLAVILERRTAFHADALMSTQHMGNHATLEYITTMTQIMSRAGLAAWQQLDAATLYLAQMVIPQATTMAYRDGFLITAAVFAFALLPTIILQRAISRASRKVAAGAPVSV
jgi:hypothetical protein